MPIANLFPVPSEQDWLNKVEAVLKGATFEKKLVNHTHDGLRIAPLYARKSEAPLVAGANAGKPWLVSARMEHPVAEEAAALACEDLEGGADALALVFASGPSARGYGIRCNTMADLDAALSGVHLDMVDIRLDPAPAGRMHALSMAALVEKRKLNPAQMRLDFGMDPLSSLLLHGTVPWDWPSMADQLGETVRALRQRGFKGPFLTVDLRPCHEAGASEGQELAAGLAQAVLYLRALEANGLTLDAARRAISFIVPLDADQFMGMAKLRALRNLWAKVETACGLTAESLRINAETSWRMMTRRDPYVNILRASVATFAAAVGGADSITVLPFTQSLGLPDDGARRLARNTSLVMMEESNLWRVVDPAAGAGGYEALTQALCEKSWALFKEIEAEGGIVASLLAGKLQARIAKTRSARMRAAASRKQPLTGTSEFANLSEVAPRVLDVVLSTHEASKARIEIAAPIAEGLRIEPLLSSRLSEPFEALRDRADAVLEKTGQRPQVTLLTIGELTDHAARLALVRNFFEIGGFDVVVSQKLPNTTTLVCLIGSDAAYAEEGSDHAAQCCAAGNTVWLAGRPAELESALQQAGVSRFVYAGCDVVEALTAAHIQIAER